MSARRAAHRWASGSAATCWSADRRIRSRCSRSACRARSASTSQPGWKAWNLGRAGKSSPRPTLAGEVESNTSLRRFPACQIPDVGRASNPPTQSMAEPQDEEAAMGQDVRSPRGPRCIALVGPFQSGKTTLLEAILARTGAIPRAGSVDAGTSVGDATPEARHHKMPVGLTAATTSFMGDSYTFLDCPGSVEFAHDMRAALPAVDAAVVVCEAGG